MNSSWLLVFKEDMISQPMQVQKALFEQFILLVLDVPGLARLQDAAARQVVRNVFVQAIHTPFRGLNAEAIAKQLKYRTSLAIQKNQPDAFHDTEEQPCHAAALLQAWTEVSAYLYSRMKRRRSLRQGGVIGGLVMILLTGGFLFGASYPLKEVYSTPESAGQPEQTIGASVLLSSNLKSLKVNEQEAKRLADFTMLTPTHLPPGYTFTEGEVWLQEGNSKSEHAVLTYWNDQEHLLRVSFYKLHKNSAISSWVNLPETTKELFLRGSKALLITTQSGFVKLDWLEHNDTYISITGREIEEEQLVQMVESLK